MKRALLVVALAAAALAAPSARADVAGEVSSAPPWIGVTMDKGGDTGVRVEHVVRGSPAHKGGVRVGDRIVAVDGASVTQPGDVSRGVSAHRVGENVALSLERTGTVVSALLVLAPRPTSDAILKMDLVGAPAPMWTNVTPLAGAPASIAQLKGRVVVVDFWATWCGPCRLVAPKLGALRDRFGAQGLSVVGLTTDEPEKAAVFAERHHMRYPVVVDGNGDTSRAYGVTALPTMILVDKKGVVRDVFVGFDPTADGKLEATVKALLAEAP